MQQSTHQPEIQPRHEHRPAQKQQKKRSFPLTSAANASRHPQTPSGIRARRGVIPPGRSRRLIRCFRAPNRAASPPTSTGGHLRCYAAGPTAGERSAAAADSGEYSGEEEVSGVGDWGKRRLRRADLKCGLIPPVNGYICLPLLFRLIHDLATLLS